MEISAPFFIIDQILGNDRVHSFPTMAVDKSWGKTRGNIYIAYAANDSQDGADIMLLRSTNGGKSFIGPVAINSRPGSDRAQWFPALSVDDDTGRVFVHYYDQGIANSGDLTEVSYAFSDDGGKHWSPPLPLSDRPFHAGWGNDTSQPNLGDYNQSVAQRGKYYPVFALASRPPGGFVDGQPDLSLTVPDPKVQVLPAADHRFRAAPLDWQGESFFDSGRNGHIDPGELVLLSIDSRNYVTNPDSKRQIRDVFARLTSSTPGVDVLIGISAWRDIKPGDTETNRFPFFLLTRHSFVPGTPIDFELDDLQRRPPAHRPAPDPVHRYAAGDGAGLRELRWVDEHPSRVAGGGPDRRPGDQLANRARVQVDARVLRRDLQRRVPRRHRWLGLAATVQPGVQRAQRRRVRHRGLRCLLRHRGRAVAEHLGLRRSLSASDRHDSRALGPLGSGRGVRGLVQDRRVPRLPQALSAELGFRITSRTCPPGPEPRVGSSTCTYGCRGWPGRPPSSASSTPRTSSAAARTFVPAIPVESSSTT